MLISSPSLIGEGVTEAILEFFNKGSSIYSITQTFITLIPKIKNPELNSQFRPISLCNEMYKIIYESMDN